MNKKRLTSMLLSATIAWGSSISGLTYSQVVPVLAESGDPLGSQNNPVMDTASIDGAIYYASAGSTVYIGSPGKTFVVDMSLTKNGNMQIRPQNEDVTVCFQGTIQVVNVKNENTDTGYAFAVTKPVTITGNGEITSDANTLLVSGTNLTLEGENLTISTTGTVTNAVKGQSSGQITIIDATLQGPLYALQAAKMTVNLDGAVIRTTAPNIGEYNGAIAVSLGGTSSKNSDPESMKCSTTITDCDITSPGGYGVFPGKGDTLTINGDTTIESFAFPVNTNGSLAPKSITISGNANLKGTDGPALYLPAGPTNYTISDATIISEKGPAIVSRGGTVTLKNVNVQANGTEPTLTRVGDAQEKGTTTYTTVPSSAVVFDINDKYDTTGSVTIEAGTYYSASTRAISLMSNSTNGIPNIITSVGENQNDQGNPFLLVKSSEAYFNNPVYGAYVSDQYNSQFSDHSNNCPYYYGTISSLSQYIQSKVDAGTVTTNPTWIRPNGTQSDWPTSGNSFNFWVQNTGQQIASFPVYTDETSFELPSTSSLTPPSGYDYTGSWSDELDGTQTVESPYSFTSDNPITNVDLYAVVNRSSNSDTGNNGSNNGNSGSTGGSTTTPTPTPPANDSGDNNGMPGSGPAFTEPGTVTKPNTDGSSTTFTQDTDGTQTATTQDSEGNVTDVAVTVPSGAITDGTVSVDLGTNQNTGTKLAIRGDIANENTAPELSINLPESAGTVNVEIELINGTGLPGTVAMIENEDGTLTPIVESIATTGEITVPLSGKQKIVIKDNSKSFKDVASNQWYTDAVAFVSARNIMNGASGTGSADFNLDGTLTRAMLAQMIANMEGQPNTSATTNPWYLGAQRYVVGKGLMGVGSSFNPDDPITRQDLALVLWRNAGSPSVSTGVLNQYADKGQVSDYAVQAVAWAVENGILGVNSPINPTNEATRAEIARMFMQFITNEASK